MDTHYPPNWIVRLCALLAIPYTIKASALFTAWGKAEGGTAEFNPLNTTYGLSGVTLYNTDGVRNYPHPVAGLCATALTLILPAYVGILSDLQAGEKTAVQIVTDNATEFDTWGTGSKLILEVLEAGV